MDIPDRDPRPAKEPERGQMNFLPNGSMWLVILLLLAAAGGAISLLLGPLGPALGACFLALWAAPTFAVVTALVKRISRRWSKRPQTEPELPPPETGNSLQPGRHESGGASGPAPAADRERSSRVERRFTVSWITVRGEDKDQPSSGHM